MELYNYTIADMADILHQASFLYMAANLSLDFGTGESYTPIEVHMLKYITDYPGKTVTELSRDWYKTKAAISQMMAKLEKKGLIYKKPAPDSDKKQLYFATEKGITINQAHINYDSVAFRHTLDLCGNPAPTKKLPIVFMSWKNTQKQNGSRTAVLMAGRNKGRMKYRS